MIKNGAYRDLRSTLETFLKQISTQYFYKNQEFRAQQGQIQVASKTLKDHKKALTARRNDLLEELNKSFSNIEPQRSRLITLRDEVVQNLSNSDLSIEELEEIVSSFEKRVQQLLGESKVTISKNLSLGRGRELNQVAFDYQGAYMAVREDAESAREAIMTKVEKDCPSIEKRLARRKLLENMLASGKMRVGKEFSKLNSLIEKQTSSIASQIEKIKTHALAHVESSLLQATKTTSIEDAIGSEVNIEDAIKLTIEAADSGESQCLELQERLSHVFGSALSEDNALVMSVQDDRIEELEKKIQETIELAQIGLSVEMIQHDLHNMYRGISGSIRTLRHMFTKIPEAMTHVNSLQTLFQHLELRYRQLEPLYRASYRSKKQISGKSILHFVRQFLAHDLEVAGVSLEASEKFLEFRVLEAPSLIHPSFVNLVDNAIYWLRSVNRRVIRFDIVNDVIVVNDSGTGIHKTMLERIFEAFTTTKQNGRGLGLYIARQSLSLANHEIWATNDSAYKVEPGACFCLKFSEKARNHRNEDDDDTK